MVARTGVRLDTKRFEICGLWWPTPKRAMWFTYIAPAHTRTRFLEFIHLAWANTVTRLLWKFAP